MDFCSGPWSVLLKNIVYPLLSTKTCYNFNVANVMHVINMITYYYWDFSKRNMYILVNIYFLSSKLDESYVKSKIFGQKSTVFKWNSCILWLHSLTGCQIVSKPWLSKWIFYVKNHLNLSDLKNTCLGTHCKNDFLITSIFEPLNN